MKRELRHTNYLRGSFSGIVNFRKTIRLITKFIRNNNEIPSFDAIACRGTSGLVIVPTVALRLDKDIIFVRKSIEDSHATHRVEGVYCDGPFSYLIVDDLISSGNTIRSIVKEINEINSLASCVGMVTYNFLEYHSMYRLSNCI